MATALDPPRGWTAVSGKLQPSETIFGFHARGDELRGYCHHRDCKRSCSPDFVELCAKGFGPVSIRNVEKLWQCSRLDGCAMNFNVKRGPGLSLRVLCAYPHVSIRFQCRSCAYLHTAPPDAVIAKLEAMGGAAKACITVEGLANVEMQPCPTCKKADWQIDALWPNVNSIGYRLEQQRKAEAAGRVQ